MKRRFVILITVLLAVLGGAFFLYDKLYHQKENEALVYQVPSVSRNLAKDFVVEDNYGKQIHLRDYYGKPIIVNFWATWCTYCVQEFPEYQNIYDDYQDVITLMMVDLTDGTKDTVASARDYMKKAGYSFPLYYDTKRSALKAYQLASIPMTIGINAQGEIVYKKVGVMTKEDMQTLIMKVTE